MRHWIWEHTEGFICGVILVSLIWVVSAFGETPVIPEPEIVTVTEYVEVPHYQIIERVVEKMVVKVVEVPVEKVVYKNYTWREFQSVDQFTKWYLAQDFKPMPFQDCDDEAMRLQRTAFAQGYLVSVAITDNGKIYGKQVTKPNHAGNIVLIDDVFYWVEPDPNSFEVVRIVNKD